MILKKKFKNCKFLKSSCKSMSPNCNIKAIQAKLIVCPNLINSSNKANLNSKENN